jgi:hypothetical protein
MTSSEPQQPAQPPAPDPALKLLDRFLGTWEVHGRTVGAEADDVDGRIAFEWLPGGFFLQQRVDLRFTDFHVEGLEIIGYEPATGTSGNIAYDVSGHRAEVGE